MVFWEYCDCYMCLFVQMKMKNGVWEGRGCEGAKLSLAIHSLWPPCLINGPTFIHVIAPEGLSLINHVTFYGTVNDLGGVDQLEMAEAVELNCFWKWSWSHQAL